MRFFLVLSALFTALIAAVPGVGAAVAMPCAVETAPRKAAVKRAQTAAFAVLHIRTVAIAQRPTPFAQWAPPLRVQPLYAGRLRV